MQTGRIKETLWDMVHGVRTRGIAATPAPHGVRYEATTPAAFRTLMSLLPYSPRGRAFVDFGSGKGRVLLMALGYGFESVTGVEYSREFHEVARMNLETFRGKRRAQRAESVCQDAREYQLPLLPLVLFFNNPFDSVVMEAVAGNIGRSLREHPRQAAILCVTRWTKTALLEQAAPLIQLAAPDGLTVYLHEPGAAVAGDAR